MAKTTRTTRKTKNQKTAKTAKTSTPKDDLGFIDDLPEDDNRIAGIYFKMKEYYGDNLANFEHHPRVLLSSTGCFSTTNRKEAQNNESSIPVRHSP